MTETDHIMHMIDERDSAKKERKFLLRAGIKRWVSALEVRLVKAQLDCQKLREQLNCQGDRGDD